MFINVCMYLLFTILHNCIYLHRIHVCVCVCVCAGIFTCVWEITEITFSDTMGTNTCSSSLAGGILPRLPKLLRKTARQYTKRIV